MDKVVYPTEKELRLFIELIQEGDYVIKKYLPSIDDQWYKMIIECIEYVQITLVYEKDLTINQISSKILYKVAKRHELGDGNKRSAVIATVLFCVMNDCYIESPEKLKIQAKRIASTKGRKNEDLIRERVAKSLIDQNIIKYKSSEKKEE